MAQLARAVQESLKTLRPQKRGRKRSKGIEVAAEACQGYIIWETVWKFRDLVPEDLESQQLARRADQLFGKACDTIARYVQGYLRTPKPLCISENVRLMANDNRLSSLRKDDRPQPCTLLTPR
jgi:hypothetical protein